MASCVLKPRIWDSHFILCGIKANRFVERMKPYLDVRRRKAGKSLESPTQMNKWWMQIWIYLGLLRVPAQISICPSPAFPPILLPFLPRGSHKLNLNFDGIFELENRFVFFFFYNLFCAEAGEKIYAKNWKRISTTTSPFTFDVDRVCLCICLKRKAGRGGLTSWEEQHAAAKLVPQSRVPTISFPVGGDHLFMLVDFVSREATHSFVGDRFLHHLYLHHINLSR